MSDAASWRLTVAIPDGRAKALREQLEQTADLDLGSNDDHLYVYAPTREAIERCVPTIRSAMDMLTIQPTSIEIDEWLEDETRWSSETEKQKPEDQGWLNTILNGLGGSSPI